MNREGKNHKDRAAANKIPIPAKIKRRGKSAGKEVTMYLAAILAYVLLAVGSGCFLALWGNRRSKR